jgi:hypothetical protein
MNADRVENISATESHGRYQAGISLVNYEFGFVRVLPCVSVVNLGSKSFYVF